MDSVIHVVPRKLMGNGLCYKADSKGNNHTNIDRDMASAPVITGCECLPTIFRVVNQET